MKTPPFLLLGTLTFWGWQSGFPAAGFLLGVLLESPRFIKSRVDLAEEDFSRIWNLCTVLTLALAAVVFTTNEDSGGLSGMMQGRSASQMGGATLHTATTLLRWLPATLLLFVAAQHFSERGTFPLSSISFIFLWRRKHIAGTPFEMEVDASYPYFMLCLLSAGFHTNQGGQTYFWGLLLLVAWALWPLRSQRHKPAVCLASLALAIALGLAGMRGIAALLRAGQNLDAQWISWLIRNKTDASQSLTSMGRIGQLKLSSRIVIRLEALEGSPVPVYLREASYSSYYPPNQSWQAGSTGKEFNEVPVETDKTSWVLLPAQHDASVVSIATYLNGWSSELETPEGLLPLPTGCSRLENMPAVFLKTNQLGSALANGPALLFFNARFGSGATFDSPPDTDATSPDLAVPDNEAAALDRVIAELPIDGADEPHKLLAVQQFFAGKFTYSLWQRREQPAGRNETVLSRFLLKSRRGHCEYFATATVLLLRRLGIPARYAVGYSVHEAGGAGYVVRERDAHAWCLAWNGAKKRWEDFDTTPASWIAAESRRASDWQWVSDLKSWLRFQAARIWSLAHLRQYIFWGLIPVVGVLLYQIIFRRRKPKAGIAGLAAGGAAFRPGLDSEFYRLESRLAERGLARRPGEPLGDWLKHFLAEPSLASMRAPLQELLRLHYRHRFDPQGLDPAGRDLLAQKVRDCLIVLDGD